MKQNRILWGVFFFLIAFSGGMALHAHAAPLNFSTAESITLSSYPTTLTIATGSVADALTANTTSVLVTLSQTTNGSFTLLSPSYDLSVATSSGGGSANISCSGGIETATLSQSTGSTVYTVTPTTQNCATASGIQPIVSVAPTITSVAGGASTYDISIESGAVTTATTSVTLSLYGTGAYTMELSNRSDFSGATWIPYATTMPWTLASSTGEQTVYAQFKSVSGIIIGSAQASIDFVSASSSSTVSPPSQSSTTTIASLTAELANLESQLAALQAEANGTTTTNHQFVFTRNLHLGMTGADVNALQLFLIAKNSGPAAQKLATHGTTTYFGALTQNALIELQKKSGITPAIGYFGAITRAWVNAGK